MAMRRILDIFRINPQPKKGLIAIEWLTIAYMAFTFCIMLFCWTKVVNPRAMIMGRLNILFTTLALWLVYRMIPCRFTYAMRVICSLLALAWWYSDTYELNRMFPSFDYLVASWEQSLFGFQPALVFAKNFPSAIISELLDCGYFMYYPLIVFTVAVYMIFRHDEFHRVGFIILAGFFLYYVVFIFFPVVGPTYYYDAIGTDQIAQGIFPDLGNYFNSHNDCLDMPGWKDGLFYHLVEDAKAAGERPTAAFPSSHVSISTLCMLLLLRLHNKRVVLVALPFYLCLCLATVYIQAHYAIDAIAGFLTAIPVYGILLLTTKKIKTHD